MKNRKEWIEISRYLSLITQVGLIMLVSVFIGFFCGIYLDRRFDTGGIFIAVSLIISVLAGFFQIYKFIINLEDKDNYQY